VVVEETAPLSYVRRLATRDVVVVVVRGNPHADRTESGPERREGILDPAEQMVARRCGMALFQRQFDPGWPIPPLEDRWLFGYTPAGRSEWLTEEEPGSTALLLRPLR
jgi:hypothetical protein